MNKEFEEYINALKEVEKENDNFELTLSKSEVLFIVKIFEQLEKENKELKQNIKDLLSSLALRRKNDLTRKRRYKKVAHKQRVKKEQLENIIKEAIKYIHEHQLVFELSSKKQIQYWFDEFYRDLLNILNKGSESNE